ncbi:Rho termination factor [Saccharomonospora sp.]|uniref:Rho termination factor n=1 Tax=Saccharomonospora sp. TaxID=33913 RepID=UPI002625A871|nr:Rho termination factor [Saccharomonospora sp.]
MPAKNAKGTDRYDKTMAELTEEAHDVGIPFVAHMSFSELIEAIEQQRETNAAYAPEPRRPEESVDTARSARKERGESSPKRVTPRGA